MANAYQQYRITKVELLISLVPPTTTGGGTEEASTNLNDECVKVVACNYKANLDTSDKPSCQSLLGMPGANLSILTGANPSMKHSILYPVVRQEVFVVNQTAPAGVKNTWLNIENADVQHLSILIAAQLLTAETGTENLKSYIYIQPKMTVKLRRPRFTQNPVPVQPSKKVGVRQSLNHSIDCLSSTRLMILVMHIKG